MDPKSNLYTDLTACHKYCQIWQVFSTIFNREHGGNTQLPTSYFSTVFPHARQLANDNNCGIYTLMVYNIIVHIFFLCRNIMLIANILLWQISFLLFFFVFSQVHQTLPGTYRYSDIDPECHGPDIAAEIVDCSSLTTECIKCVKKCNGSELFRIHESSCNPARHFHMRCISKAQIVNSVFKCQICDPTKREEYCFKCHDLERISRVPDFFCYIYQTWLLL